MPRQDTGFFMPTEAYWDKPDAYLAANKVKAAADISYLSAMDQFYAQLEEQREIFELGLTEQQRQFDLGLGQRKDEAAALASYQNRSLEIAQYQAETGRLGVESEVDYRGDLLGLEKQKLSFEREKADETSDWFKRIAESQLKKTEGREIPTGYGSVPPLNSSQLQQYLGITTEDVRADTEDIGTVDILPFSAPGEINSPSGSSYYEEDKQTDPFDASWYYNS